MEQQAMDEKTAITNFLRTFGLRLDEEGKLLADVKLGKREIEEASGIINYILQQLNSESLLGAVKWKHYETCVINAVRGLFKLVYVQHIKFKKDDGTSNKAEYYSELIRADVIFTSANNYLQLLFTRVFEGSDREILKKKIEALRPVVGLTQVK